MSKRTDLRISHELDLFAYATHALSIPGVNTRHKNIDIVTIRECTEGEFVNIEHEITDGVVQSVKLTTEEKSRQIAEYAFYYAKSANRKKVTVVHKANIMKRTDGLFLNCAREVAKNYPEIEF